VDIFRVLFFTWTPFGFSYWSYELVVTELTGLKDLIFILSLIFTPLAYFMTSHVGASISDSLGGFAFAYDLPFILMTLAAGKFPAL